MKRSLALVAAAFALGTAHAAETLNYSKAANQFGMESLQRLLESQPDKNVVYSPVSAHLALGMILNGADQKTAEEISSAVNIPLKELAQSNAKVAGLLKELNSRPEGELKLSLANGLWTKAGVTVKPDYLKEMKQGYQAEVDTLNSAGQINDWANKKTNGMIKHVLDSVDGMVMLVANATYFKADWMKPFDKAYPGKFNVAAGNKADAKMMNEKIYTSYTRQRDYEAIELPYGKNKLASMIVILPEPNADLKNFRKMLTADLVERISDELKNTPEAQGTVTIPKVEFKTEFKMNKVLADMGMETAFTDSANFNKMASQPVKLSFVKQDAAIKIDEKGTEAAAVTTGGFEATSVFQPAFTFVADRPFFYVIKDNKTGVILFAGQIMKP
jgi:serine protease inhibitor